MSRNPHRDAIRHLAAKVVADIVLWGVAGLAAFFLRVPQSIRLFEWTVLIYPALSVVAFLPATLVFRLPRQVWRQVTVRDLVRLGQAVSIVTVVMFVIGWVWYLTSGFPRSVPLLQGAVGFLLLGGTRLAVCVYYESRGRAQSQASGSRKKILIVGAGDAGSSVVRELSRTPSLNLDAVGYLDDDPIKRPLQVSGLRVLGGIEDLPRVVRDKGVQEVLIAIPSASGKLTRRVVELAHDVGVPCRTLPGVGQILSGQVAVRLIREVQVEDLLRREPADLDEAGIAGYVKDQTVLVTGAGGSIGAELVRQVAAFEPRHIVLFGRGENSLHAIEQELRRDLPNLSHTTVVGSICDQVKVAEVMAAFAPQVVFHAAAHKHVPMMEFAPDEAILNNVGGTRNIAQASLAAGVQRFVNISTDKAVNPVSMVGVTKAIAERAVRFVAERAGGDQSFVSVRFGNVLGSRGSVVPVFQEQIRRGGPVTITDPQMTRFFMTIPEASRLVIQAGALGQNGAVYVLDMGTPVRIVDMVQDMIRLSGAKADDIEIVMTGLRPGEKMHEELFTDEEQTGTTRVRQIMVARLDGAPGPEFEDSVDRLVDAAQQRAWHVIDHELGSLVPGFTLGDRGALEPPHMGKLVAFPETEP